MSSFWHWWIIVLTLANIAAMVWLIKFAEKRKPGEPAAHETTGHVYDDDLTEYNKPMPRWWLWLFYGTIIFSLAYLVLFPGLGNYQGVLGWSSAAYDLDVDDVEARSMYGREVERIEERLAPIFRRYAEKDFEALAFDDDAMATGRRLFGNECAICHGADGGGTRGFPNISDGVFSWGGEPDQIIHTITNGRRGVMPPHLSRLEGEEEKIDGLISYVFQLAGREVPNEDLIPVGAEQFVQLGCAACHGEEGTGNPMLGAPDLTAGDYTYGASAAAIRETILHGRQGQMPAFEERLGPERVRVLAAYVYRLNREGGIE